MAPPVCGDCREPLVEAVVENMTGRKALVSTYSMTARCTKSGDGRHHPKAETRTCGCCGRTLPASQVPFNHRFRDGRPDMDYCVDCNDAGCDLDTCELPDPSAQYGVDPKKEVAMTTTPEEAAAQVAAQSPIGEQMVTMSPQDLAVFVQDQVAQMMGGSTGVQTPVQNKDQSFDDVVDALDPEDSEAALAMLDHLLKTGRLQRVGVLDGGGGYLFMYQEPKGSTKEGYRPGATQGDRIVDESLRKQRDSGATPAVRGLCQHCFSGCVEKDGVLVVEATGEAKCSQRAEGHELAG